jgi:uncharacterized membrane protein YhhN
MKSNSNLIFGAILTAQLVFAGLALVTENFLFKSGSAGFGALAVVLLAGQKYLRKTEVWFVLSAFLFSIGGDYFLSHRNGELMMFVYGIGLFFIAHIGYLGYALANGRLSIPVTLVVSVGYLIFFFTGLYPGISDAVLMWAALAYLIVSCISMGAAWGITSKGIPRTMYIWGIGMIVFSDTLIAFREFMAYTQWDFLILPTYYLAHILVTASVWKRWGVSAA